MNVAASPWACSVIVAVDPLSISITSAPALF